MFPAHLQFGVEEIFGEVMIEEEQTQTATKLFSLLEIADSTGLLLFSPTSRLVPVACVIYSLPFLRVLIKP